VWNNRPARRPIVGELDRLEEMDVCLSPRELRECLSSTGELHTAKLLSGQYLLEPWFRWRVDADGEWITAHGIEVTRDEGDDSA